jgi:Fe-S-cluster-containing dehydrogenase component/DMSO reductase anchor subunit
MAMPLLARAKHDDVTFIHVSPATRSARALAEYDTRIAPPAAASRMPDRQPVPGEQYRFHVNMAACIGCKCCVVACNEQNGNPAPLNWRRVDEVEGGWYPETIRAYVSMGCNHCLEPTCLAGCPVDAYSKDPVTGIVRHSADTCIGCQYCTWNCSYGVPQYNPERGVVGKCDMCHGRLELGQSPACVNACPEGAIAIEIVNIEEWRQALVAPFRAPGVPGVDGSLSTTRVTMAVDLPPEAQPRDLTHVVPEQPHWPLVVMTVLTQLSAGAFLAIWLLQIFGATIGLDLAAAAAFAVGGLALSASTLHLGRPIHAIRAVKMWRRSWLSREVLVFSAFAGVAGLYAAALWARWPGASVIGALTSGLGIAGVFASACIYRVFARPAWNSRWTVAQFFATGALLGPLFVAFCAAVGAGGIGWLRPAIVCAAAANVYVLTGYFLRLIGSDTVELRGTARLLSTVLAPTLVLRGALLVIGGIVIPLVSRDAFGWLAALGFALTGEIAGRYLFFVSVVPRHMTAAYLAKESEAA